MSSLSFSAETLENFFYVLEEQVNVKICMKKNIFKGLIPLALFFTTPLSPR